MSGQNQQSVTGTTDIFFTAIAYFNNRTKRTGSQMFWGYSQQEADDKATEWRVHAVNCEVVDEFTGQCQYQNLNQQREYLDYQAY